MFGKPICSSTGEGSSGCPEQSDPAASRMPRSSSAIISVAGSRPSTLKQTRCGARCVGCPWTCAPGTSRRDPLAEPAGQRPVARGPVRHVGERRREGRRHAGDPRRVLHAGAPLALAVVAARVGGHARPRVGRRGRRRPAARRTCGPTATAGRPPSASTSTGRRPTVWQASVWKRTCDLPRQARGLGRPAGACPARGSRAGRSRAACRACGPPRRTDPCRGDRRRRRAP